MGKAVQITFEGMFKGVPVIILTSTSILAPNDAVVKSLCRPYHRFYLSILIKNGKTSMTVLTLSWDQFGVTVAAIGAFGTAAFGLVESVGKAFTLSWISRNGQTSFHFGLPYVGFSIVKRMIQPLLPALKCAYGDDYLDIIAQQYRVDRVDGAAPDTIRQGVRLGLPFLDEPVATRLIGALWDMKIAQSQALARALQSPDNAPPGATPAAEPLNSAAALAGRFAAALDARVTAAFELADERYETWAKTIAGGVALLLAFALNFAFPLDGSAWYDKSSLVAAIGIGLVAVPIAPVAKDISTSLQNALTAFKSIAGKN